MISELGELGEHTYVPNPNAVAGVNRKLTGEEVDDFTRAADERAQLGLLGGGSESGDAGQLTIPGLNDYECTPGDMYGKEPTVVKVALSILIDVVPKFAIMMNIRNFHISRLIFMTLSGPPSDTLKEMSPVIDIFSAKKFDVSLNSSPFPVKMYSGTVIQAGVLIDIERVAILGIPIIRRAYFRFSSDPFMIEAHLYIENIQLAPLIEITGIRGKQKFLAQQKQVRNHFHVETAHPINVFEFCQTFLKLLRASSSF